MGAGKLERSNGIHERLLGNFVGAPERGKEACGRVNQHGMRLEELLLGGICLTSGVLNEEDEVANSGPEEGIGMHEGSPF